MGGGCGGCGVCVGEGEDTRPGGGDAGDGDAGDGDAGDGDAGDGDGDGDGEGGSGTGTRVTDLHVESQFEWLLSQYNEYLESRRDTRWTWIHR